MSALGAIGAVVRKSILVSKRSPTATIMSIVIPLNFLIISSLFAIGGGTVPLAVVSHDPGPQAQSLVQALNSSYTYRPVLVSSQADAQSMLNSGAVIGILTIPQNFDSTVNSNQNATVTLQVNNFESDSLFDLVRGVSVASYNYYSTTSPQRLAAKIGYSFTYPSTTGFEQYIGVAVLGIALFLGGLIYGGQISSREFEQQTVKELLLSPTSEFLILVGQAFGSTISSTLAGLLVAGVIILVFGILPLYPLYLVATFVLSLTISNSIGVMIGVLLKRLQFVAPLAIGLSLPMFLLSGVFGPETYSVPGVVIVAQLLPGYYIVGLLEYAFHGINATPFSALYLVSILAFQAVVAITLSALILTKRGLSTAST